jgi:hypothetical protein
MELKPVKSSMISKVGYDEASQSLHVEFPNGRAYVYEGVSPEQHSAFMGAESVGKHFASAIRGQFQHRMLEPEGDA